MKKHNQYKSNKQLFHWCIKNDNTISTREKNEFSPVFDQMRLSLANFKAVGKSITQQAET